MYLLFAANGNNCFGKTLFLSILSAMGFPIKATEIDLKALIKISIFSKDEALRKLCFLSKNHSKNKFLIAFVLQCISFIPQIPYFS